ncbi:MAG: DUF2341 domain-containing protein [Candidatus Paceibacterota bacterium]
MPSIIRNKKFIISFFAILFLIIGVFCYHSFKSNSQDASAAGEGWLSGYSRRKAVTITNSNTGTAGTINGNPVLGATGKFGTALNFDGSGDYVSVVDSGVGVGTGDFTYDFWVKFNAVSGYPNFINSNGGYNPLIRLHAAEHELAVYMDDTASTSHIFPWTPTTGVWYHVAVVRNSGSLSAYVNGTQIGTSQSSTESVPQRGVYIGKQYNADYCLNGLMDEVRISNIARWTSNFTPPTAAYANDQYTKLLLHLNETSGTTVYSDPTLTDHQVKLTVPYDSDMQADFDDLRFTSSDGSTSLNYWLESKTDSSTATVWVKVPSLSSGSNTIYMYYGNASATSGSNGTNTFRYYSDFSDTSNWDLKSGASISDNTLTVNVANPGFSYPNATYANTLAVPYVLYYYEKIAGIDPYGAHYRCADIIGNSTLTGTNSIESVAMVSQNANRLYSDYSTVYTALGSSSWDSNWYWFEHKVFATGDKVTYKGITSSSAVHTHASGKYVGLGVAHSYCQYQNFIIREYAAIEPTASFGSEEIDFTDGSCISSASVNCSQSVDGSYIINTYTLSGSSTGTATWTVPAGVSSAEYLVVAGGGGGGAAGGGGGGGGGLKTGNTSVSSGNSISITVGAGGIGQYNDRGTSGAGSVLTGPLGTIASVDGGGGGASGYTITGLPGGSGGGGSAYSGTPGSGISGQGNSGGAGAPNPSLYGGGGGGAGGLGQIGTSSQGGSGGLGLVPSITPSIYYAGGGGGFLSGSASGGGGSGASSSPQNGNNGTNGLGGGGGGGSGAAYGGAGGSGVVVIRYIDPNAGDCVSTSSVTCTQTTNGSYIINTYTLSGSSTGSTAWIPPTGVSSAEYLVVGGGGSGGGSDTTTNSPGGGGGAGGFRTGTMAVSSSSQMSVSVGAGGAAVNSGSGGNYGNSGDNSSFGLSSGGSEGTTLITSNGGGGGGKAALSGLSGGSGGGAPGKTITGGSAIATSPVQGYKGGDTTWGGYQASSGGGGAGGAGGNGVGGANASVGRPGDGGAGSTSSITGSSLPYAAGGGGGSEGTDVSQGLGGSAGGTRIGGNGGVNYGSTRVATAGAANTGSGGGGAVGAVGVYSGAGGSGVVVIRYIDPNAGDCISTSSVLCSQTTDGDYIINTYTLSGSSTGSTTWTPPTGVSSAEYLVVAGGGSGGSWIGGGGGAGGVRTGTASSLSGNITITVGAGGASVTNTRGNNGSNSLFGSISATGGGGGGTNAEEALKNGSNGGSGGGGGYYNAAGTGGAGNAGGYSPVEGYAGGEGYKTGAYYSGGGGGAGGPGQSGSTLTCNGGAGVSSLIYGTSIDYGGGGGGCFDSGGGAGGTGGGGSGGISSATAGTNGRGGGGGGVRTNGYASGAGGSGIVVIKYSLAAPPTVTNLYVPSEN